ncbi:MAG: hypothetical protein M3Q06_07080 [Bacteroidota bacterium]|nr:hypothetical protein [Bacteroidota bacterium]
MRLDKGSPAGANKNDSGTGVPTDKFVNKPHQDQELTDKYTEDEQDIADSVRQNNPNRNTSKGDATNQGGYKQ